MDSAVPEGKNGRGYLADGLMVAGLAVIGIALAVTQGSEEEWIRHAITGTFSFILLLLTVVAGATMRGRINVFSREQARRIHRITSIAFVIIVTATFILGLLPLVLEGHRVLGTPHGLIGLTIVLLALIQLVPHHVLRGRRYLILLHRYAGYLMLPLFILQMILGIGMSEIFEGGN